MVAITALALFLTAVAGANAAAVPVSGSQSYSIDAIHNEKFVRNGTAAMLKVYAKYGLKPLKAGTVLGSPLGKRQDGVVTATPDSNDDEYLCPVSIGGQTLHLDFDTGSSDLWVFSTKLPTSDCSSHTCFSTTKSSTFKTLSGYTWQISYGDGSSASGTVGTDTVVIGGTTVKGQAVELATRLSSEFVSGAGDGLVGLAFNNINTVQPQPQKTFLSNAVSSLQSPIMAAYLPFRKSGAYDFGYTDSTKYSGTIEYANVDSSGGFWEFPSTSYKVGGTTYPASSGTTGIADTGTTLLLMSDAAVNNYYSKVSGATYSNSQGGYIFPCSATLPTLSFKVGPTYYATIPATYLNFGSAGGSSCFGSLQSIGSGSQNIYGDIFFNAYYVIFDTSVPRLGFATAK